LGDGSKRESDLAVRDGTTIATLHNQPVEEEIFFAGPIPQVTRLSHAVVTVTWSAKTNLRAKGFLSVMVTASARAQQSRMLHMAIPEKSCQGGSARARARAWLTVLRRGVTSAASDTALTTHARARVRYPLTAFLGIAIWSILDCCARALASPSRKKPFRRKIWFLALQVTVTTA